MFLSCLVDENDFWSYATVKIGDSCSLWVTVFFTSITFNRSNRTKSIWYGHSIQFPKIWTMKDRAKVLNWYFYLFFFLTFFFFPFFFFSFFLFFFSVLFIFFFFSFIPNKFYIALCSSFLFFDLFFFHDLAVNPCQFYNFICYKRDECGCKSKRKRKKEKEKKKKKKKKKKFHKIESAYCLYLFTSNPMTHFFLIWNHFQACVETIFLWAFFIF